ncbi:MAG: acyltransferase family protein [Chloroflexota bacterium]
MASNESEAHYAEPSTSPAEGAAASRLPWIDVIRAGGAFLVVLAHVVLYPALRGSGPLWAQSLYYTASRVAVPLFFMASGYLLLGKDEGYSAFYRKRALRVFVPFIVWSFIYLAWNGGFSTGPFTLGAVADGLLRILRGPRASHLWFFYVLISLYLITPTLRIFTANARPRDLVYFCGLWFLLDPVLNLIRHVFDVQIGFEFLFLTGYIGYYVLGHLLGTTLLTKRLIFAAAGVFLAAFAIVFVSVYAGQQSPTYDQFFEGYLSVTVVLLTAAAFILTRSLSSRLGPPPLRWIKVLSSASLGIYLLHIIALDVLDLGMAPVVASTGWGSSLVMMPLAAIVGYVACFVIVFALQRLPVIKYAVP